MDEEQSQPNNTETQPNNTETQPNICPVTGETCGKVFNAEVEKRKTTVHLFLAAIASIFLASQTYYYQSNDKEVPRDIWTVCMVFVAWGCGVPISTGSLGKLLSKGNS
jgi:hypothetical protein